MLYLLRTSIQLLIYRNKNNTANEDISMLEFLIDNIFEEFGVQIIQQIIVIPMEWTVPMVLLVDLFIYSYGAEFVKQISRAWQNKIQTLISLSGTGILMMLC
jgi:hypothetical protein